MNIYNINTYHLLIKQQSSFKLLTQNIVILPFLIPALSIMLSRHQIDSNLKKTRFIIDTENEIFEFQRYQSQLTRACFERPFPLAPGPYWA